LRNVEKNRGLKTPKRIGDSLPDRADIRRCF
jgi:hypothetical protein